MLHLVVDCSTSHCVWRTLKKTLAFPSNSRIMQLHGSFQDLWQGDSSVSLHMQQAVSLLGSLCLITTPTLAATGVALEVIGIPTATVPLSRTEANLLQIGGQTTGSRPGAILVLGSGLDSSMYAANCARFWAHSSSLFPVS